METKLPTRFFLGANSPGGFQSLYSEFTDPDSETLYILKGGPGCGKSTLMRSVGRAAEEAGLSVEYIHCSGDPMSLDGVRVPERGLAWVDGTSPHVIEPVYAGSQAVYVNLGAFYDLSALAAQREDIGRLTRGYKEQYARAFRMLSGAAALSAAPELPEEALLAAARRARSIVRQELRGAPAAGGRSVRRFLSAFTCLGPMTLWDTVPAAARRIWALDNDLGLGNLVVEAVAQECQARSVPVIRCQSPLFPRLTEHLLVPSLGFALVTVTSRSPCPFDVYRHLRLDAVPDRSLRAAARRAQRLRAPLMDEALQALKAAKSLHDELEALYIPNVDFAGLDRLAERHIALLG